MKYGSYILSKGSISFSFYETGGIIKEGNKFTLWGQQEEKQAAGFQFVSCLPAFQVNLLPVCFVIQTEFSFKSTELQRLQLVMIVN